MQPVDKLRANVPFAFESRSWNEVVKHCRNLKQVFRQKDQEFINLLNEVRVGVLSKKYNAQIRLQATKTRKFLAENNNRSTLNGKEELQQRI